MTQTAVLQRGCERTSEQNAIRPFQVDIPEPELIPSDFELNFGRYLPAFGPADADHTDTQPG